MIGDGVQKCTATEKEVSVEKNVEPAVKGVTGSAMETKETASVLPGEGIEQMSLEDICALIEENIRLKLPKGQYQLSMSCETGFALRCELD